MLLPWAAGGRRRPPLHGAQPRHRRLLGVVCTALTFSLVMDGMRYIKVQHTAIMGYIEPVSAPLYALVSWARCPRGGRSPAAR